MFWEVLLVVYISINGIFTLAIMGMCLDGKIKNNKRLFEEALPVVYGDILLFVVIIPAYITGLLLTPIGFGIYKITKACTYRLKKIVVFLNKPIVKNN